MTQPLVGKLCVFDLDGTVIDSTPVMRAAFTHAYQISGGAGTPPFERFLKYMGAPLEDIMAALNLPEGFQKPFLDESRANIRRITPYRVMLNLIRQLDTENHVIAIYTGKDRARTTEILHHFGVADVVWKLRCGDDGRGKPDPEGLVALMDESGRPASRTIMVGDSTLDMTVASAAGVFGLGCCWNSDSESELLAHGATLVAQSPDQAARCVQQWTRDDPMRVPGNR